MSETTHYQLYVTDDDSDTFMNWRNEMNATQDSNMTKIDDALYQKALKSTAVSATLLASGWAGVAAPFTQTIAVEGLGADQNGTISIA